MLREKRTIHDLRYQVRDVNGNNLWIRCYGILKWNEDKSKPLFFSGRVTHQDKNFVVDPITNFPREHASFQQLDELRRLDERALVIGFSLNGFSEINTTKGRAYGDRLLKNVADALTKELFWKMSFFRLEGMRCMAVVNSSCMAEGQDALVEQIRAVIQKCYASMDVSVQNFCSFGIMEYPNGAMTPDDLVENLGLFDPGGQAGRQTGLCGLFHAQYPAHQADVQHGSGPEPECGQSDGAFPDSPSSLLRTARSSAARCFCAGHLKGKTSLPRPSFPFWRKSV